MGCRIAAHGAQGGYLHDVGIAAGNACDLKGKKPHIDGLAYWPLNTSSRKRRATMLLKKVPLTGRDLSLCRRGQADTNEKGENHKKRPFPDRSKLHPLRCRYTHPDMHCGEHQPTLED